MRRAAAVDANQAEIVAALRGAGASVLLLHQVGGGCPDILVGHRALAGNALMEIKDGSKPPSARRLTPAEQEFFDTWRGQVCVVNSVAEALGAIGCKVME